MKGKSLTVCLLCLLAAPLLRAQNRERQVDSLVSLLSAQSVQLIEKNGVGYRKVTGPARFFHNNTYLVCDTALWNMSTDEIECMGNVKILQNETVLSSDRLIYLIKEDLAQFRGTLVQLEDKDRNTLRTRHLDYNTKDSVAVFENGGALRDKEGQIIESNTGTYESKLKLFTFIDNVNMFTDSIFVKTTKLEYNTDRNMAWFGRGTDAWRDDDMLSSDAGWYDRPRELFLFYRNVHGMTEDREVWSDTLYFWRNLMNVEMLGHVQLMDTVRDVSAVAGRMMYEDSVSRVTMTRDPAVIGKTGDSGQPSDTVYIGADTLIYKTYMAFQIDSARYKVAAKRKADVMSDAVTAYRVKAAEEARKAAEEAKKKDPNYMAKQQAEEAAKKREARKNRGKTTDSTAAAVPPAGGPAAPNLSDAAADTLKAVQDSLTAVADSLSAPLDSLSHASDSLSVPAFLSDSLGVAVDSTSRMQQIDSLVNRISDKAQELVPSGTGQDVALADSLQQDLPDSLAPLDSAAQARADSIARVLRDSLARADSIRIADSIARLPKDSTRFGFLTGLRNVRLFRTDIQMRCDSLEYGDLDSLVRLYKEPIIWNELRRQYVADSLHIVPVDGRLDRAYLMSNAFIIIQEDEQCFDQIRSTEMLAFFDSTGALRRFDALGEANAVFYLQEDSVFATVNKSQSKMLSTEFLDGNIDKVYYFDAPKTDAYPLAQMTQEDRVLKGFNWLPDNRPTSPQDITDWKARPSERRKYSAHPRAKYTQTDIYFPGYMDGVYKQMRENELRRQERERLRQQREAFVKDSLATALRDSLVADSLRVVADSLHLADSLKAVQDSLKAAADSLQAVRDSLAKAAPDSLGQAAGKDSVAVHVPTPEELKAAEKERKRQEKEAKKQAREAARAAKLAAKEREWARLDSLDAVKDSLKALKALEKERARKLKIIERAHRQEIKDMQKLERYRQRYARKKAREEARAARRAEREAAREARKAAKNPPKPQPQPDPVPEKGWMKIEKVTEKEGLTPVQTSSAD